MIYKKLRAPALVVPGVESWAPRCLAANTVVGLVEEPETFKPSPLALPKDRMIAYGDERGRMLPGFLAQNAILKDTNKTRIRPLEHCTDEVGPVDQLRDKIARAKLPAAQWLAQFGTMSENLPLLQRVIRELGGVVKAADDPAKTLSRVCRVLAIPEVKPMARHQQVVENDEDEVVSTKSKKHKEEKGKKEQEVQRAVTKEPSSGRKSMLESVGDQLLEFVPDDCEPFVTKLATKMSKGDALSAAQYTKIAAAVKECDTSDLKEKHKVGLRKALIGVGILRRRAEAEE